MIDENSGSYDLLYDELMRQLVMMECERDISFLRARAIDDVANQVLEVMGTKKRFCKASAIVFNAHDYEEYRTVFLEALARSVPLSEATEYLSMGLEGAPRRKSIIGAKGFLETAYKQLSHCRELKAA